MLRLATLFVLNWLLLVGTAESLVHLGAAIWLDPGPLDAAWDVALGISLVLSAASAATLLCLAKGLPLRVGLAVFWLLSMWLGPFALLVAWPEPRPGDLTGALVVAVPVALLGSWVFSVSGRPWLSLASLPPLTRRRLGSFLWRGAAACAFVATLLAASFAMGMLAWGQEQTRGFVAFDLEGVSLGDRRYVRGDAEVRLVGMMHLGERERYRELVRSFVAPGTVVLTEGVTDRESLLATRLSYAGAAEVLGVEAQADLREYLEEIDASEVNGLSTEEWPVLRHADLDLADFQPETRSFLEQAAALWSSPSLLEGLSDYLAWVETQDEEVLLEHVARDVIDLRNAHLGEALAEALEEYPRVVVPWGALHLPGMEEHLLAQGFSETERSRRPLLSWRTLLEAALELVRGGAA